jgi:hypothetical protein
MVVVGGSILGVGGLDLLRGVPSTGGVAVGMVLDRIGGGGTGGTLIGVALYTQNGGCSSGGHRPSQSAHPCPSSPHFPQRCGPYSQR